MSSIQSSYISQSSYTSIFDAMEILPAACACESIALGDVSHHRRSEFLRRVPDDEWNACLETMQSEANLATPEDIEDLRQGRWKNLIFEDPYWIYSAFHGYLENRLDKDTMCKLFLYNACLEQAKKDSPNADPHDRVGCFQLFNERGEVDEDGKKKLREATETYLDEAQFEQLCQNLQTRLFSQENGLRPDQTQFFSVRREKDPALIQIAGSDKMRWRLCIMQKEEQVWQAVMPPELMYEIHRARFGKDAIYPEPIMGYADKEKFSNISTRIASIPFFRLPKELHGQEAEPLTFYHHDVVYHHAIESGNMHRAIFRDFALFLKKIPNVSSMVPVVLDRELANYIKARKESGPQNFWVGLGYCQEVLRRSRNETSEIFIKTTRCQLIHYFIVFYLMHQEELIKQYGLDLSSLKDSLSASDREVVQSFLKVLHVYLQEGFSLISNENFFAYLMEHEEMAPEEFWTVLIRCSMALRSIELYGDKTEEYSEELFLNSFLFFYETNQRWLVEHRGLNLDSLKRCIRHQKHNPHGRAFLKRLHHQIVENQRTLN